MPANCRLVQVNLPTIVDRVGDRQDENRLVELLDYLVTRPSNREGDQGKVGDECTAVSRFVSGDPAGASALRPPTSAGTRTC